MNNNNLLGVNAEVDELLEVDLVLRDPDELKKEHQEERDACWRAQKACKDIHEEGRELQDKWVEIARWMAYEPEDIPRELRWGLELKEWSDKMGGQRTDHEYWQQFAKWLPDESMPRELQWGYALLNWRTKWANRWLSLKARFGGAS